MNRYAAQITIVICAIIVVGGGIAIALRLHSNSTASPPISTSSSPAGTPATTPASTPTPVPASDFLVCITPTVGCNGEMHTQPTEIIVSGDGSAFISGLTWTGWGQAGATGSGTLRLDNCEPNCAQGKLTPYAATVTLSGLTSYGSAGKQGYADMMVSAPGSPFGTRSYSGLLP
jgi:hypothetical protein